MLDGCLAKNKNRQPVKIVLIMRRRENLIIQRKGKAMSTGNECVVKIVGPDGITINRSRRDGKEFIHINCPEPVQEGEDCPGQK